jgi:cytosine/adenosine deaminase-related metal-dependent hydrolase
MKTANHGAGWVFSRPGLWIENGTVEIAQGRIVSVGVRRAQGRVIDHGPGVIMPAMINGHTHLSLSALRGKVDASAGFISWVRQLISARSALSDEEVFRAALTAARDVRNSGTGALAEVGPIEPGARAIAGCGIEATVFKEMLGNGLDISPLPLDQAGLSFSFAGHGLHTTAPELLRALKTEVEKRGGVFSLHLAESDAETQFLRSGEGPWAELLHERGIDFSGWGICGERPVERALRLGLLTPRTLAVHLLEVNEVEVSELARTGTSVCVCPRSNYALHGRLPDINGFCEAGLAPALGTDSLAGVPSLNLFDEMAFVLDKYPGLSPFDVLPLVTINGARALGRNDLGAAEPGRRARLIYVDVTATSKRDAALHLTASRPKRVEWL